MKNLLVAQIGARMHYAVPRMLHAGNRLERLYTDLCAVKGLPRLLGWIPAPLRPAPVKRLLGRVPHGLPRERITAFGDIGREYARRRALAGTPSAATAAHLWAGRTFCERIVQRGLGRADGVYTFNSAGLELLRHARRHGALAVMEQTIAPMPIERELMQAEHARFPEWQAPPDGDELAAEFIAREQSEWQSADLILCGSEFVRDGVARCGGPAERCAVVPYGVDARFDAAPRSRRGGPLRVLTVGEIGLRKGSPYVLAAAKLLGRRAHFRMVGPVGARPVALEQLKARVEVAGPVPRAEILAHYTWADVFLLPSLCEGSATVTYEALACGLPVIATPNTGSIVRDGEDGFIVPIRDPGSIAARLELLLDDRRLQSLSAGARRRAREGMLPAYALRLHEALGTRAANPRAAA